MAMIGYHASHEQFSPAQLLACARRAESAGFQSVMCSDHFHPWSRAQGHSGHAWSWLGAAMASTACPFGVVNAPAGRYHPAVIAQAAATLAQMFPQRLWLAVGSGEAINETITGDPWPDKSARNRRLREAVDVMRALWRGEEVDHDGAFTLRHARLYSLPDAPPPLYAAALSAATARWAAPWADGLITLGTPEAPADDVIRAFRENGGAGKRVLVQVKVSFAEDDERALQSAFEQWKFNAVPRADSENLETVADFERKAARLAPDDVARAVHVSADPCRHVEWLRRYRDLGADEIHVHNVNRAQEAFIDAYGRHVIGALE